MILLISLLHQNNQSTRDSGDILDRFSDLATVLDD